MAVEVMNHGITWLNVLIMDINMENKEKAGYLMMLLLYFLIILLMISCNRHVSKVNKPAPDYRNSRF